MTKINFSILEFYFVFIWIKGKIIINDKEKKRKMLKKRDHNLIVTKRVEKS